MKWLVLFVPVLLVACVEPTDGPAPGAAVYSRPAPSTVGDTNVYTFRHEGPNRVGTVAVTAWPTKGPNAAPGGSMANDRALAEAAAAFYAQNELCDGEQFGLASDASSRFDTASNAWTVFGRCPESTPSEGASLTAPGGY